MGPELYWIKKPPGGLAISARPRGGDWLEDEVSAWRRQSVDIVVSLLTDLENQELGLASEATLARQKGIQFYSFPIDDRSVPSNSVGAERLIAQLSSELQRGKSIAIHCRQGIGRSALLSAAVLISSGEDCGRALKAISEVRGVDVPETSEQKKWLADFAKSHAPDLARQHH